MGARNGDMAFEEKNNQRASEHCFPLTPDSPLHPTLLPHVKESLEKLETVSVLPITPPSPVSLANPSTNVHADSRQSTSCAVAATALFNGLHVLAAERDALNHLHHVYATDAEAQDSFSTAASLITQTVRNGGKLVVSGVGKSGKIGQKFVATCNSLRVLSVWLHPIEALHGDLGMIGPNDVVLLLTFSSKSAELHALLPHIRANPLILLTGRPHTISSPNPVLGHYSRHSKVPSILLPAPVPVPEPQLFGVSAPTTSTTVALALCDALAIATANALHGQALDGVFKVSHPGGAIGEAAKLGPSSVSREAEVTTDSSVDDGGMDMG